MTIRTVTTITCDKCGVSLDRRDGYEDRRYELKHSVIGGETVYSDWHFCQGCFDGLLEWLSTKPRRK